MIEASGDLLTTKVPSSLVLSPDVGSTVYVKSSLNVKIPDAWVPEIVPDHLQFPNNITPGSCVPHCCNGEDDDGDEGKGEGGELKIVKARIIPTIPITATIGIIIIFKLIA